jgi:hypothetical protein
VSPCQLAACFGSQVLPNVPHYHRWERCDHGEPVWMTLQWPGSDYAVQLPLDPDGVCMVAAHHTQGGGNREQD